MAAQTTGPTTARELPAVEGQQLGAPGPSGERLPHFRLGFTPSGGAEIQTEYAVAREHGADAIQGLRRLARLVSPRRFARGRIGASCSSRHGAISTPSSRCCPPSGRLRHCFVEGGKFSNAFTRRYVAEEHSQAGT